MSFQYLTRLEQFGVQKPGTKSVQPQKLFTYDISDISTALFCNLHVLHKKFCSFNKLLFEVQNIGVSNGTLRNYINPNNQPSAT